MDTCILLLLNVIFGLMMFASVNIQSVFQYAEPEEVLWTQDSIPKDAGERVVLYYNGPTGKLRAYWVVVLVNSPYHQTRTVARGIIEETFGIESEKEIIAGAWAETRVDSHTPKEPLYGDGFSDFHAVGIAVTNAREYRIRSKDYNRSRPHNYSRSEWRIIDCHPLFNKHCALLVISRTDHSREWAWMHPGIPLPFKQDAETKLVTDKEIVAAEKVLVGLGQPGAEYFVPNIGYKTDGVINFMQKITKAAKSLP